MVQYFVLRPKPFVLVGWVGWVLNHPLVSFFVRRSKGLLSDLLQTALNEAFSRVGDRDCFQLSSISVFENPFVSYRQFFFSDSMGRKSGNTSRCRCYHSYLTLPSFSFHTLARDMINSEYWKGAVYPILHLFFGVRSVQKIFRRLLVCERRPRLTLFLEGVVNLPTLLICNPGYFSVSRRSWWKHLS